MVTKKNHQLQQISFTMSLKAVHYQNDFSPGRGNALQAAVASILGLDLNQVPNFIAMPNKIGYEAAIREFCQELGLDCIKINLDNDEGDDDDRSNTVFILEKYNGLMCVLRGKSPRGDFGHVVVAKNNGKCNQFEMVHDPHPESTFLDESEAFGWCMFFVSSVEK